MEYSTIISSICSIILLTVTGVLVYFVVETNNNLNAQQAAALTTPTVQPRTYYEYPSTDFPAQGDLSNTPGTIATCQPACDAMTNCTGFTFDGTNCYFKNTSLLTTPVYNTGMQFWYTGNTNLVAAVPPTTTPTTSTTTTPTTTTIPTTSTTTTPTTTTIPTATTTPTATSATTTPVTTSTPAASTVASTTAATATPIVSGATSTVATTSGTTTTAPTIIAAPSPPPVVTPVTTTASTTAPILPVNTAGITPETYLVSYSGFPYTNSLTFSQSQQAGACPTGQQATLAQLQAAQQAGADWCNYGWFSTGTGTGQAGYPANTSGIAGCSGSGPQVYFGPTGSLTDQTTKYNLLCYGPKPAQGSNSQVQSFSSQKWSQFS